MRDPKLPMSTQRDQLGRDLALLGFAAEVPFAGLNGRRRWRFDWGVERWGWDPPDGEYDPLNPPDRRYVCRRVAVEYNGIMRLDPSHGSIAGLLRDAEKWTQASIMGWTVVLAHAKSVDDGTALAYVRLALGEDVPLLTLAPEKEAKR